MPTRTRLRAPLVLCTASAAVHTLQPRAEGIFWFSLVTHTAATLALVSCSVQSRYRDHCSNEGLGHSPRAALNRATVEDLRAAAQVCDVQESDSTTPEAIVFFFLCTCVARSRCDSVERQVSEADEAVHHRMHIQTWRARPRRGIAQSH